MATLRLFQAMINDYLSNPLLKEEMVKRDYLLSKIEKDDGWIGVSGTNGANGGALVVPFKAAGASSVSYGQLTASNDIADDVYVRGTISQQPEFWATMQFHQRDLMEHGKISEKNFLKILPDTVDDFTAYIKGVVSVNLLNGAHFAKSAAGSVSAAGLIVVDRPDRFVVNQKVVVQATAPTTIVAYVKTINMNTRTVSLVTTRGGATPTDFAANNAPAGAKFYNDGAQTSPFSSVRDALLSAANGGSATLYGVTKTDYPYTQAINIDGTGATSANLLKKIFNGFTDTRKFGKGAPTDVIMSYSNFGVCMALIEASKGAYNVVPNSHKAEVYGWTEITVGSVTSQPLKLVAVQEMDDDVIYFMDWRALKFYSNGFFKKNVNPDGNEFYTERAQSGYKYIIDICLFGDLVVNRPSYCGVMFGIDIDYTV